MTDAGGNKMIVIDSHKYGMPAKFASLEEAIEAIRACGSDGGHVTLHSDGDDVFDGDGAVVGYVERPYQIIP